jgi:hypothetical protein
MTRTTQQKNTHTNDANHENDELLVIVYPLVVVGGWGFWYAVDHPQLEQK